MPELLLDAIWAHWSSTKPAGRSLAVRGALVVKRPQPAYPDFLIRLASPSEAANVRDISPDLPPKSLPAALRNRLLGLADARSARGQALLNAFFEQRLIRSRLPHTPLQVNHLDFGGPYPLRPNRWLTPEYLPMKAKLFNLPGKPFGALWIEWTPAGRLLSVVNDSLQSYPKRGAPPPTAKAAALAAMSRGLMDSATAYQYFRLRYEPAVATELLSDLEFLGREGRALGLALLAALA